MSRIEQAFKNGKAFIAFVTCGDPDLETTEALVKAMAEAGADIIELGIPFSDPVAEGPVIQAANARALAAGTTTDKIFQMVRRLRQEIRTPLVFMTYANVVFSYGTARFLDQAAAAGMDGLILPDVPYEEREEFSPLCRERGLDLIPLVAPCSQARIGKIAAEATGFVYCVSSMGVTGERSRIDADLDGMLDQVRSAARVPAAIGFGISTPEQAAQMAEKADGVIVGSAIVRLVGQYGPQCVPHVVDYIRRMKAAIQAL